MTFRPENRCSVNKGHGNTKKLEVCLKCLSAVMYSWLLYGMEWLVICVWWYGVFFGMYVCVVAWSVFWYVCVCGGMECFLVCVWVW